MWGLGVLAYTVAVFHRASLGVSELGAQHHFGTTAAVLSPFGVVQLGASGSRCGQYAFSAVGLAMVC